MRAAGIAVVAALFAAHVAARALPVAAAGGGQASASDTAIYFRLVVVSTEAAAQALVARIRKGEQVETLALNDSIDPSSDRGGLMGPVDPAELRSELRDALAGLAVGQTGPIARVPSGFAIVQRVAPPAAKRLGSAEITGLSATGAVQPTVSVDGFVEANTVLQEVPKDSADWNQDPQEICRLSRTAVAEITRTMEQFAANAESDASVAPIDRIQAEVVVGQFHAYQGRMTEAIDRFSRAYTRAQRDFADGVPQLEEMLGVSYLHRAGLTNGVFRTPGDRCLLSSSPVPYADTRDLGAAIGHFTKVLAARPADAEAAWLLNLAHMAAGTYPGQVPAAYRVPPSALESAERVGRFTDVAAAAGLDAFSSAGGVVVDDFDNDGTFEILTSNFDSCGPMRLFRRGRDGRFTDQAAAAGLSAQLGGLNLVQADYDNDGCRDVLVLRGGWQTAQRRSLLHNNCDGTFTDVTAASGLARPATSSQTAVWADIDNDGLVDLFVGNEGSPSQLFRNAGNGTFTDIAPAAGVARRAFTKGVASSDIDNDGDVDLYVSNLGGGNFLYRNNGDRTFGEVALDAGVPGPGLGFPTWFFDYDNDGWDDLFVAGYYLSIDEIGRRYLGRPRNADTPKLYRNLGNGRFADVTAQAGLDKVYMPMGSNFGDIDNDGFLDIFLGGGSPSYGALAGSTLLRNVDGRSFVDVTASSGTGELHKGHGVAFADLDDDGDQEIAFRVGGATPGDAHAFRLFENPGHDRDWIGLRLEGVRSNRAAIGARITVTVRSGASTRTIHRTVTSGGSFGASPLQQHVGLGRAAGTVDVEVRWPSSGTRQRFAAVPVNQVVVIREDAPSVRPLPRRPLPLRGTGAP